MEGFVFLHFFLFCSFFSFYFAVVNLEIKKGGHEDFGCGRPSSSPDLFFFFFFFFFYLFPYDETTKLRMIREKHVKREWEV